MAIELYWGSGSPFAWRVMLALEVKKLPYESKLMEFSKGEHKTPAYLQLNPRGKVPTLKDGDFAVYESIAIMAYLDRKYPDPPLFGKPRGNGISFGRQYRSANRISSAKETRLSGRFFSARVWTKSKKSSKRRRRFAKS